MMNFQLEYDLPLIFYKILGLLHFLSAIFSTEKNSATFSQC